MENKQYVPLHVHTEYSLLDGAMRLKDYVEFAKKAGWKSIAICDHDNVFGAVKFFQLAEKAGIQPILGIEMYFIPDTSSTNSVDNKYYHLTVFVKNETGYQNLCRLIAFSYQKGFYFKPRIDFAILEANCEGLIILSGCIGGLLPSLLLEGDFDGAKKVAQKFISMVGRENYFIEVMPPYTKEEVTKNTLLINLAKEFDLTVVATPDSHYLLADHHQSHEVMLSIGTKNLITDEKRFSFKEFRANLKTTEEMLSFFPDNPEFVWNTEKIAQACTFKFKFGELFFPQYQIPSEFESETSYFLHLCRAGLQRIFDLNLVPPKEHERYMARLELEAELIARMGFAGYFLVVSDFIAWSKKTKVPVGPGRGSGAGSLVAWALEITGIDPIKYNLLFERFLNPERVSMPDFDIDFCILGREKVINYVKEKYGHESVCQIITFGTMAAKGVVKDVARVLGFSFSDSQMITDLIPDQLKISLKDAIKEEPLLAKMISENIKIKELFDICFVLEGVTRHASKHAAGVVISPKPLKDVIPLYVPAKTNELVTQYAMTELDAIGFLKMDFLGLKNLTVIDRVVQSVKKNYGIDINLETLPIDDAATFKTLCQGKTSGIFQFEGGGVTDVLVKLQPEKFEDLIALNALYRPGPLGSGMVDDFIDGRHGKKEPVYLFEELRPILEETYGVIVYQEQVMKIASAIAGYSLGGADLLRRAMGKKKPEEMAKQKSIFLDGAAKFGFDAAKADKLFELMAYFAGYGFNKSHSAAYALIAYQTAYLKTHFPKEFEAAILSFETSDPKKLQEYLQKTREVGVKVFPPNINLSESEFSATKDGVLFGLSGIKNVGTAVIEEILTEREKKPFSSILNFMRRINLRTANKRVLESLIYAGAFDDLLGSRAQKIAKLDYFIKLVQEEKENEKTGQVSLFAKPKKTDHSSDDNIIFDDIEDLPNKEKLMQEKEVLGFYLSSHPLDEYKFWIQALQAGNLAPQNYLECIEKKIINVALITQNKTITTKNGKRMAFLQAEDSFANNLELICFPGSFPETRDTYLQPDNIVVFYGTVGDAKEDLAKIKIEKILEINDFLQQPDPNLILCSSIIDNLFSSEENNYLKNLSNALEEKGLNFKIFFKENSKNLGIVTNRKINPQNKIFLEILTNISKKIWFEQVKTQAKQAKNHFT